MSRLTPLFLACSLSLSWCQAQSGGNPAPARQPFQLDQLLDRDAALWSLSGDAFEAEFGAKGFRWTSDAQATARAYKAPIRFLDWPVVEALAEFGDGTLKRVNVVLYARGDLGDIAFAQYQSNVSQLGAALNKITATAKPAEIKQPTLTRGVRMQAFAWVKAPHQIVAEWSHSELGGSRMQPEFVRVRLEPFDPAKDPRSALAAATAAMSAGRKGTLSVAELRRNVVREANGDVVIKSVPMVDQGPKGYCAVATAERILSYYGLETDQHVMAQLAQSSADGGTSLGRMMAGLQTLGPKLGCRVREQIDIGYGELESLAKRYDREAKKQGKPPAAWTPPMIDIGRFFDSMDKAILLDLKAKEADAKRLPAKVKESIDKGIPLTWGVMLGLVPEVPALPQAGGGHLRLIIGYNPQTKELLYSDSWGQGHELKRMSFDAAWGITTSLHTIEPRHLQM